MWDQVGPTVPGTGDCSPGGCGTGSEAPIPGSGRGTGSEAPIPGWGCHTRSWGLWYQPRVPPNHPAPPAVVKNYFQLREFSFTLRDDVYVRFQSFGSPQELERELQKTNPYKIDIGAVYSHRVSP